MGIPGGSLPSTFLPRDAMHKRCLCRHAVSVCLSVCLSVTFLDCVETNKHIFKKIHHRIAKPLISVPNAMALIFRRERPPPTVNRGVECTWGMQKSRFSAYIGLHCVLKTVPAASAIPLAATHHGSLWVSGKRRSQLMAGYTDEVYDKKPQSYTEDNVTQWLIWNLSNNNQRLRTSYFVEASYWRTQSIVRPLYNSRTACYFHWWQIW